jgi:hypothetical protein
MAVQMSGADLTRVHIAKASETTAKMNQRRVAVVANSEEALTSLSEWTAANCSRPDDMEFKLLVRHAMFYLRLMAIRCPVAFTQLAHTVPLCLSCCPCKLTLCCLQCYGT